MQRYEIQIEPVRADDRMRITPERVYVTVLQFPGNNVVARAAIDRSDVGTFLAMVMV